MRIDARSSSHRGLSGKIAKDLFEIVWSEGDASACVRNCQRALRVRPNSLQRCDRVIHEPVDVHLRRQVRRDRKIGPPAERARLYIELNAQIRRTIPVRIVDEMEAKSSLRLLDHLLDHRRMTSPESSLA